MNLIDYVKEYGNYTFFEKEFNEVDAAILSFIIYIDFNNIVDDKNIKIRLDSALEKFLNHYDLKKFVSRGIFNKDILKLSKLLKDKNRFKDILLSNYIYDVTFDKQFGAITMFLPTKQKIIVFEGTDHTLAGWEEDFTMVYKFFVPAQLDAVKYVNKNVSLFDKNVILLGHSKGGHLAMVGAGFCNPLIKFKIKKIYNFDGPGFRKEQIESRNFKSISKKLCHIVPYYSIVGLLLDHGNNIKSVKSSRIAIYAHSIFTWDIREDSFVLAPLSKLSENLDKSIKLWLELHNDVERERIIKDVFDYFRKSGIENLFDIKKINNLISLIKNNNELDKETKEVLGHFIKFNLEYHLNNK